jgi:hypothetical protein
VYAAMPNEDAFYDLDSPFSNEIKEKPLGNSSENLIYSASRRKERASRVSSTLDDAEQQDIYQLEAIRASTSATGSNTKSRISRTPLPPLFRPISVKTFMDDER